MIAVLAAALVAGGREPSHDVLATAPVAPSEQSPGSSTALPTPPVELPKPSGREVKGPASPAQRDLLASVSAQAIPGVALSAYQRASIVINAADPSCHMDWSLLAAIGQVESDHGQVGGSRLNARGVAHPRIIGPRLDGRHGTSRVRDTDAGRLDGDPKYDRAVGPMQFLPSTWAAVAVDGDDDGRRDVQDIDDASLGSAVYLCADHDNLSTRAGAHAAVLRYNHSQAYAARVLAIAHALRTSSLLMPTSGINVRSISFDHPGDPQVRDHPPGRPGRHHHSEPTADPVPTSPHGPVIADPVPSSPTPTPSPTQPPSPTPTPWPSPTPTPTPTPWPSPTPTPTPTPWPTPTPTDPGDPTEPPVIPDPLPAELAGLTPAQVDAYNAAWAVCDDDLVAGWSADPDTVAALTQCLADEVGVPADDADLTTFVDWLADNEDPVTG